MNKRHRHDDAHPLPLEKSAFQAHHATRLYAAATAFFIATLLALPADLSLARLIKEQTILGGDARKMVNICEVFGFSGGAALICLSVWTLDPARRRQMPRLLACVFGAGIIAALSKQVIARTRPHTFDFHGSVLDTFGPLLPWTRGALDHAFLSNEHSFPSGHAATAVGLAIGLAWMYPQGGRLFTFFAALAILQRIIANSHYLSDTMGGATIACLVCGALLDPRILGKTFLKWEQHAPPAKVHVTIAVSKSNAAC